MNPEKFIKVGKTGIEVVNKPPAFLQLFSKVQQFNRSHTEIEFGNDAGIYTDKQLRDTETCLT